MSTPNCIPKLVKTSSYPKELTEINLELRRTLSNNTLDKDLNLSQELQNIIITNINKHQPRE